MRIAVCDDEKVWRDQLEGYVLRWASEHGRDVETELFKDTDTLLQKHLAESYDLILLDIQMQGQDGMELAKELREGNDHAGIIFVTGYEDYLEEGYEVEAFRYMLKPVTYEKLGMALNKYVEHRMKEPKNLILVTDEGQLRTQADQILYAEAFKHDCDLHTGDQVVHVKISITDLEKRMKKLEIPVARPHRSYLVNLLFVQQIQREQVLLCNGETVPVSRGGYGTINQAFIQCYSKKR